ncbi:MAG: Ig-like domain-containing protein [Vicinamibacteria bacterium]
MRRVFMYSLAVPAALLAQYQGQEPMRTSVAELTRSSMMYNERPVIVVGELSFGDAEDTNYEIYELRGEDALRTVRVATPRGQMEDLRFNMGQKVELQGIFFDLQNVMDPQRHPILRYFPGAVRTDGLGFDKNYFIAVTSVDVIEAVESDLKPEKAEEEADPAEPDIDASTLASLDLRELVEDPTPYMGKNVVVLGKFRGSNLYGDLSIRDKRTPRDFVIKVADAAIWVTGRRPRGKGFRLDASKRRDTGEWLRVIGEPWEYEGTVYLKAVKIELAEDPGDPDLEPVKVARAEETELGPPPEITFTLPLEGDKEIPLDSEFQVQFSKDMKAESFHRNVDLLYADDDGIGNPFPDLEVSYDGPSRTLKVQPHKSLEPGREIRLILYDAIVDAEGQKLPVNGESTETEPGAAAVLTFTTARS